MVRALTLLYEATGGDQWDNNARWLAGEPCIDGWFGVYCCPQSLPILAVQTDGSDVCTADGSLPADLLTTQGSALCHSGNVTGTILDIATCVVVKVLLPDNNLIGPLDVMDPLTSERALCGLPFLQRLDLSANELSGRLPSLDSCLPQLIHIDITHKFGLTLANLMDTRGLAGPIPEWLLTRLESGRMTKMQLAQNAFDDPTSARATVTIRRLWAQCSTGVACTGVPPVGCSAFNSPGKRFEVELNGMECVQCPNPLETLLIVCAVGGVVGLIGAGIWSVALFMQRFPEHARTHAASFMILLSHLQVCLLYPSGCGIFLDLDIPFTTARRHSLSSVQCSSDGRCS